MFFSGFGGQMSHKISLRLIGNMEYKHRVFVCVISYSIQQFHLIKHSSPLAMDSWTPPRPDAHRHISESNAVHVRNFYEKIDHLQFQNGFYKSFSLEFEF